MLKNIMSEMSTLTQQTKKKNKTKINFFFSKQKMRIMEIIKALVSNGDKSNDNTNVIKFRNNVVTNFY